MIAVRGDVVNDIPDDEDADEPVRRTDETSELAFHHALPSTLWDEIIHAYQLGAMIDIAAGEGSLARHISVRSRIPYTGLVFTSYHTDLLMERLLDLMSTGSLNASDMWYDPNL
jgi:hypothetical protein